MRIPGGKCRKASNAPLCSQHRQRRCGGCWGQSRQSDDCFLPILSASKGLAGLGLPPDSGFSPPGASSACWHGSRPLQLGLWEMLPSCQPALDTPGWAATPRAVSPGTCWGGTSVPAGPWGAGGPSGPDELAALTPSHRILFSLSTFPHGPPSGGRPQEGLALPLLTLGLGQVQVPRAPLRPWRPGPAPWEDHCTFLWIRMQVSQTLEPACPPLHPTGPVGLEAFQSPADTCFLASSPGLPQPLA